MASFLFVFVLLCFYLVGYKQHKVWWCNIIFHKVRVNSIYNFFWHLLFYCFCRSIIVEFYHNLVIFIDVWVSDVTLAQIWDLVRFVADTHSFLRTVSLLFILLCCWNCSFTRNFMFSSFCHIFIEMGARRVAFAYLMLADIIFSTCLLHIWLLVLIFFYIALKYFIMNALCSIIFMCWMPM